MMLSAKLTAADKAWKKDRDAAERVLLRYGLSLPKAIPAMVDFWLRSSCQGGGDGDEDDDEETQLQRLSFAFADTLNRAVHGQTDPTTNLTVVYPIQHVAVAAEVLRAARDMPDSCETVQEKLQYLLTSCALDDRMDADAVDSLTVAQVALPLVFGATRPITMADVDVVQSHLSTGDVSTAAKLVTCFSGKPASSMTVVASPAGASMLPVEHLRAAMDRMAKMAPVVLFRVLTRMHCLGPGVFEKNRVPAVMPPPGLCGLKGESLVHHYARYLETIFEHVP